MPVQPPWTPDIDTIVGVAITLLAVLVVQVVIRLRDRWRERSNRQHRGGRPLRIVGGQLTATREDENPGRRKLDDTPGGSVNAGRGRTFVASDGLGRFGTKEGRP